MGVAATLSAGFATSPGAAITAVTASTPDTFAVQNFDTSDTAYLEQMWAKNASGGVVRFRSPRLHDPNQGLRLQAAAGDNHLLLPYGLDQRLYPGDTPTVETSGGGAETDTVYAIYSYSNLPGVAARLAAWPDIEGRVLDISCTEVDLTASATPGQWGTAKAINATFDNFKAGSDYAILGYVTNASVGAVAFQGAETGQQKIGGPGVLDHIQTRDFFIRLSQESGRSYIPVFNANNKAAFNLLVNDTAANTAVNVSVILARVS